MTPIRTTTDFALSASLRSDNAMSWLVGLCTFPPMTIKPSWMGHPSIGGVEEKADSSASLRNGNAKERNGNAKEKTTPRMRKLQLEDAISID